MAGKKGKSGGAREGAGRPHKEPSTTISFRVPLQHAEGLKEACRKAIESYLKKVKKPK